MDIYLTQDEYVSLLDILNMYSKSILVTTIKSSNPESLPPLDKVEPVIKYLFSIAWANGYTPDNEFESMLYDEWKKQY